MGYPVHQPGVQVGSVMFILGGYDCPGNACLTDPTVTSEIGRGAAFAARPGFARPLPKGRPVRNPAIT